MGKSSKLKQRESEAQAIAFQIRFAAASKRAATPSQPAPLLQEFEAYRDHFIRDPNTFTLRTRSSHRSKQVLEMARHLFVKFRVPRVLEQAWAAYLPPDPPTPRVLPRRPPRLAPGLKAIDFRAWFICVASGGSLYKQHTKGLLTKKETHLFLNVTIPLDLCQAIVYAIARAAGATEGGAQRLARSRLSEQSFIPFWFDAVRFFSLPEQLPAAVHQVNDLCDFLAQRRQEDPHFRLTAASQSLPALLRRMEEWHRALARAKDLEGISWDGVDIPDYTLERRHPQKPDQSVTWRFHQITTGKELAAEGSAMRHCVYGYKAKCADGRCSIWSLTYNDGERPESRRLTLEVNENGSIVQKRGLANRLPRPEENHVVREWAKEIGFSDA